MTGIPADSGTDIAGAARSSRFWLTPHALRLRLYVTLLVLDITAIAFGFLLPSHLLKSDFKLFELLTVTAIVYTGIAFNSGAFSLRSTQDVSVDTAPAVRALLFTYGVLLIVAYTLMRGRLRLDIRERETRKALLAGIFVLIAYGVVIIAYSMGPAGPITAIRETSVVFAMIIGRLFLGETLTPKRIVAGLIVAAGAIAIGQ